MQIVDGLETKKIFRCIVGLQCVQVWIGYANNLFVGFGKRRIHPDLNGKHPQPPYELQLINASWLVGDQGSLNLTSESLVSRDILERRVNKLLLGKKVSEQPSVVKNSGLICAFDQGLKLKALPYNGQEYSHVKVWEMCTPSGNYISMFSDGIAIISASDEHVEHPANWL